MRVLGLRRPGSGRLRAARHSCRAPVPQAGTPLSGCSRPREPYAAAPDDAGPNGRAFARPAGARPARVVRDWRRDGLLHSRRQERLAAPAPRPLSASCGCERRRRPAMRSGPAPGKARHRSAAQAVVAAARPGDLMSRGRRGTPGRLRRQENGAAGRVSSHPVSSIALRARTCSGGSSACSARRRHRRPPASCRSGRSSPRCRGTSSRRPCRTSGCW
jgi:hypothetical protein